MPKSVCVVGAGPSGLAAAKSLLHNAAKGEFKVTIFESQHGVGGLWPTSKTDSDRMVHPSMTVNQSRNTMQFSELAWEDDAPQMPPAWQVGKYLERYRDKYLTGNPNFELHLGTRVSKAEKLDDGSKGWRIQTRSDTKTETRDFDYLLIASGYFGKPFIPDCFKKASASVPVIHSSQYRDLKSLIGKGKPRGKILVVGGQMSGVEIAGTIASHLSSAVNSPEDFGVAGIDKYSIYHAIQRPIWVFPLYTTPEVSFASAPFVPIDLPSYNIHLRPRPLTNSQGHISEDSAKVTHGIYEATLGNQEKFSPLLQPTDEEKTQPVYIAVSDWYTEFVRSGMITLSSGKVASIEGDLVTLDNMGSKIDNIVAVVLATGFDSSPCLDFLPDDVLEALQHSPRHLDQALALAFHGSYHPDVSNLGFVGFYRSAYWGVIQMQSRFITELWTDGPKSDAFKRKLQADDSIERTLRLRDDPRVSQFVMGDYGFLMQEYAEALSIDMRPSIMPATPVLTRNNLPLEPITPSWYSSPSDDADAKGEAEKQLKQTRDLAIECLTTPRYVARGVFRSLLGTWRLERNIVSRLPSHPSGRFVGHARFLLREHIPEGLQCASDPSSNPEPTEDDELGFEYLYIEEGDFTAESGFTFKATRHYIWRYSSKQDRISVWFAKPNDLKRADYLFHEVEFEQPPANADRKKVGWTAKAGHLCIDDYYDVKYNFAFESVNLAKWSLEYRVNGPSKDYTINGRYERV